jgi:hypothetical protein
MKRYASWIVLLVVCAGGAVMAKKHGNDTVSQENGQQDAVASANPQPDATAVAAYRDGLYMGKLDSKNGDDPHVAVARWSQPAHRAAFTEGYNQGFKSGESARTARTNMRLAKVIR